MRWQRRKPLWPLVAGLTLLFALAIDAPRNWQNPQSISDATRPDPIAGAQHWYDQLYPPTDQTFEPISSPVIEPALPESNEPLHEEVLERYDLAVAPTEEALPQRAEFDFDSLMEIRDSVRSLLSKLPELDTLQASDSQSASTAPRVVVNSSQDRLAMRPDREPAVRRSLPIPFTHQKRLEKFADLLIDAARRQRLGEPEPVRVAVRAKPPTAQTQVPIIRQDDSAPSELAIVAPQPTVEEPPLIEEPELSVAVDEPQAPVEANQVEDYSLTLVEPEKTVEPEETTVEEPQVIVAETIPEPDPTPPALPQLRIFPQALVDRLEAVADKSPAHEWSGETLAIIRRLAKDTELTAEDAGMLVEQLADRATAAKASAEQVADHALRQHWLRLIHALERRTAIWQGMFDPETRSIPASLQVPTPQDSEVLAVLNDIVLLLDGNENGEDWRDYLLLDQIATASSPGAGVDVRGRRKLAQEVLSRMTDPRLTEAQREFVKTPEVAKLQQLVLPWAIGPVDLQTLAALVERYDENSDSRYGAAIAQLKQRLQWSPVPEYQQLSQHLDDHFRGANMRVALSDDLLQRMLPKRSSSFAPVNDKIGGTKVKGRSRTTVNLETRMIPNDHAWQISLIAKGAVYSKTKSDTWPASVNNTARMFYEAHKTVMLDSQGLRVSRTKATARGRNELVGIDSDFDPIPILSHLVKDVARRKHHKTRGIANRQVKAKVIHQARTKMDRDADPKIHRLEDMFVSNVLGSLEKLALLAEPTEMYTTSDRAVMLLRLANAFQLGANSLRPLAPADSMASLQLHESVLNNAVAGLDLEGKRLTAHELHDFIALKLGRTDLQAPNDLPERAKIEFAPYDAVRVKCHGDRIEVVLNIREVSHGRDKIRNFAVHAYFRPRLDGLNVQLVREGTLQFEGKHLRTGPRVVLHGVFGKLLRKDQEVPVLRESLANDPRLAGLMVTQLVIDDGWIGLALGPELEGRTAWRSLPHVVR